MAFPGRTSEALVKGIMEVEEGDDLTPFIGASNELVTELCTNSGYTAERLQVIETWLAGHFYHCDKNRVASEGLTGLQTTFQGKTAMGFDSSYYGQMAKLLDTAGNLAFYENGQKKFATIPGLSVGVSYLGTPPRRCNGR